jgi:uncharacterized protein YjbI with pentapeptide repeats
MRLHTLAIALLLWMLCWINPAQAANPDHIAQLLETRSCSSCDLREADFRGMNLSNTTLTKSDLTGANLMATNLTGANLIGANLNDALMYSVNLTDANLRDITMNAGTSLSAATVCRTTIPSGAISNRDCPYP